MTQGRGRAILAAAILVFVFAQMVLTVHETVHGDEPHDHDGVICAFSLAAPSGEKFIAATIVMVTVFFTLWGRDRNLAQTERARIVVRAASPRGPPAR